MTLENPAALREGLQGFLTFLEQKSDDEPQDSGQDPAKVQAEKWQELFGQFHGCVQVEQYL